MQFAAGPAPTARAASGSGTCSRSRRWNAARGMVRGAEARQVARGQLAVDDRDAVAQAHRDQVRERDLRGVALAAEHRFAEEHAAQAHPVEAADERAVAPGLDAVGVTQAMQLEVGGAHLGGDPGARARRARRGAAVDHRRRSRGRSRCSKPRVAQRLGRLRDAAKFLGNSTARGSGDHHSTGWPGEYQGKMPRR